MRLLKTLLIILIAVAGVGWLGYNFWLAYQPVTPLIQGQIEARQYTVSSKVAGRIDEILVKKGDMVEKGQLVFTIHSPEIAAKLEQAKAGRLHILDEMAKTIQEPRADYKPHVPRIEKMTVPKEFIGAIIGPGGKVIQEIQKETNSTILIEEVGDFGIVDIKTNNPVSGR